jgi:hypothetical protein
VQSLANFSWVRARYLNFTSRPGRVPSQLKHSGEIPLLALPTSNLCEALNRKIDSVVVVDLAFAGEVYAAACAWGRHRLVSPEVGDMPGAVRSPGKGLD